MKLCTIAVLMLVMVAVCTAWPRSRGHRGNYRVRGRGHGHGGHYRGRSRGHGYSGHGGKHGKDLCKMARHACKVDRVGGSNIKNETCEENVPCNKGPYTMINQNTNISYTFYMCSEKPTTRLCKPGHKFDRRDRRFGSRGRDRRTTTTTTPDPEIERQEAFDYPPQLDTNDAERDLCEMPKWESLACLITNVENNTVLKNVTCEDGGQCSTLPQEYQKDNAPVTAVFCQGCEDDSREERGDRSRNWPRRGGNRSREEDAEEKTEEQEKEEENEEQEEDEEEEENDQVTETPLRINGRNIQELSNRDLLALLELLQEWYRTFFANGNN